MRNNNEPLLRLSGKNSTSVRGLSSIYAYNDKHKKTAQIKIKSGIMSNIYIFCKYVAFTYLKLDRR